MEQIEGEMKKDLEEQKAIRDYLLGALTDESETRMLEEKLFMNDDFNEKISVAEDNLIEEYLDGSLNSSEKKRFNQHFLSAPERKKKLRFMRTLRKVLASKEKKRLFNWRKLIALPSFRLATAAVLILLFGFIIWRVVFYQSDVDKGVAQLNIWTRGQRPNEARTTLNSNYAPFIAIRGEPTVEDEKARKRAYGYLSEATDDSNDAKAHHALGIYYLFDKQFDEALREFNIALKSLPNDAKLNNDIGATYLEMARIAKAKEKDDEIMGNLAQAQDFVSLALKLDDSLLEALFNKALILQNMPRLTEQAQHAWEDYLKKDSTSRWADEARRNLEELKQQNLAPKDKSQILQDFLDAFHKKDDARAWEVASQTRELIEGVMIHLQLTRKFLEDNQQSRKEEADETLSAFVYLGELEKQNSKDLYFSEVAEYYKNTNQKQREKLLEAHNELQKGHKLIKGTKFKEALEILENAKNLFIEAGDIWEKGIAEYQIYYSLSRLDRIKESNEKLQALSNFAEQKNYKWLQVLADGWIGATYFLIGESSKAISYDEKTLKLAEEISDNYNTHRILVQLMEIYRTIGEPDKALLFTYRNLILPDSYYNFPRQKWRDLNYATEILQRFKFYAAAAAFGEEAVNFAQNEVKDDWMLRTSRRNLALIYGELKKFPEAFEQADLTLQLSQILPDEAMRKRLVANSFQILADLQRQTNRCSEAIENYERAIETYQQMEFEIFKYDALKGRLLCNINQQNDAAVREEFLTLLQRFDEDRKKIGKEEDRLAFFDAEQSVYDSAINYAFTNLKDSEQSFNYTENSRSRSLLNLLKGNSELSQPLSLSEIRAQIPAGAQMLYYAALTDKILIWQISAEKFSVVEKLVRAAELNDKVQEYSKLVMKKNDDEKLKEAAKELYGILIQPVESSLEVNKSLCIVADKMLYRVPFSSLVSPQTDRYLVEDYALIQAPSATIFINETEIARQKEAVQSETILSIGNPSFSQKEYPKLEKLPAARREAEEIARLYDSPSKVFVEKEAVKEQIVANLNETDVINFAGHYVPNDKSPARSKLLLASSDLTIEEIMQKQLSRPRLLILSACDTGVEKLYNGEGMIGASRAFLASGIPLVVASQWSVDSSATADLIIKFHRYRKLKGLTTIAALRQAQIDMLRGENQQFRHPYFWASFLPIGGHANY
jgi:CHAT domain-containing protein/tetratricopeptide (TPR) repeat protein